MMRNKTKMAYSPNAIIRDQQETRERQEQSETSVRLDRYGDMEDGVSQSNKMERAGDQRDMELFRQLGNGQTNRQTDKRTYRAIP